MSFYPPDIHLRSRSATHAGSADGANAEATAASFACGSFATVSMRIDEAGLIVDARFRTNGCGFMTAAADVVAGYLRGKALTDLHGLNDVELRDLVHEAVGSFPVDREECATIVFEALHKTLSEYRASRLREFKGEEALICTCFGVTEETIVAVIAANGLTEVGEVSDICRAGAGCGSCRMLIRELIDMNLTEER